MTTATVNGASLAVREQGSGDPVLFIHGTGTYSEQFDPVLDALPPTIRAIVYDRRGFASSSGPRARRLADHVDDAAGLLEAIGATPATVVGSSAGGVLALRLAIERPELVSALVLIEPAHQVALVPSPSTASTLLRVHLRWLLLRDPEGAAVAFYRWATRYTTGGNQFDAYPEAWRRTGTEHAGTALRELAQLLPLRPTRRALRRLTVPVWVVIGDAGVPVFRRASRRVLRRLPHAVEVPAVGAHLVYTDDPTTCADAIVAATGRDGGSDGAAARRRAPA